MFAWGPDAEGDIEGDGKPGICACGNEDVDGLVVAVVCISPVSTCRSDVTKSFALPF